MNAAALQIVYAPETGGDGVGKIRQLEVPEGQFFVGVEIPIKVWGDHTGLSLFEGGNNLGTGSIATAGVDERRVREAINFSGTNVVGATFPITSLISATAINGLFTIDDNDRLVVLATPGASIMRILSLQNNNGIKITSAKKVYGSVRLSYNRSPDYRRWYFKFRSPGGTFQFFVMQAAKVIFAFTLECESTESELTGGSGGPADVSFVIKDNVTGQVVPGATLYLDGGARGVSDADGVINVHGLTRGQHLLSVSASGYVPTAEDNIVNDTLYF